MVLAKGCPVIFGAAVILAACTSSGPAHPSGATSASSVATSPATGSATGSTVKSSAASSEEKTGYRGAYRRVVRNGTEYYCRYESVAGKRIMQEVCLTKDQLAQQQQDADALMRQVGELPGNPQSSNPSPHR